MNDTDNRQVFEDLKKSLKEAVAISRGELEPARRITYTAEEVKAVKDGRGAEVKAARLPAGKKARPSAPDVKALRKKLDLSQNEFARLIQVNVRTLQNWEQGYRQPTGPAAALLKLVEKSPETALEALSI
jgi:DNA-binding transcriptional regulator YiaG